MIITKKAIPRRTVLRGLGVTVSLPLLDAMVPAVSALTKTSAKPAPRFGVVYVPNGIVMQNWRPATDGAGFEVPPILQPLAPFRQQLFVISGLYTPPDQSGGPHSRAATRFLTDLTPMDPEKWQRQNAISMDQRVAQEFGRHTELASLELGLSGADFAGGCSGDLPCSFSHTIAWRSASTPLPMEHNPRAVFERLFGDSESTDPKARRALMREHRSILDSVSEAVARLRHSLGPRDRVKVGAYLDAVRDIERRIEHAEAQDDQDVPLMARPRGIPPRFAEHTELMYDLWHLAWQMDRTRVTTFMAGHELNGRTYPEIGVPDAHHPLSHHQGNAEALAKLTKINTHHMTVFASFLEKLRSTPDGDGSLLDHAMILYGAGMSDSNSHSPRDLPILLLGGGTGQLRGGRHVVYAEPTPLANLHVTLMDRLGLPVERMGDSTGKVPDVFGGVERLSGI